jgi:NADP-dependent 3-hydroxy acid dehydrogenase YdfG
VLNPDNRVILISGANRGIGRAIAQRLEAAGYTLSLGGRDRQALATVFGPESDRRAYFQFLAHDRSSHQAWVDGTVERWGRIDGLINNAGVGGDFTIEQGEEAELDRMWTVNCKAPLFMTRACLPHLKAGGSGRVINISSLSGKRVRNVNVAYAMSKHALMALSNGTRRIGWDAGVRVTTVCPGFVRTDMTSDVTKVARDKMIDPADLAELVATAIALPNTAAIAELLVNCSLEDQF